MSLKEDYSGICTGGFDEDMAIVFQAGKSLVATGVTAVAASAIIHQNDLDGGTSPGDVSVQANTAGIAGNSITFTGDGVLTVAALGTINNFTVISGDSTQILELGDVITLSGGADASSSTNATLSTGLTAAAAAGNTDFTVTVLTSFEPVNLRLQGVHMQTYFAGIIHAMSDEGIYSPYVTLVLNTSDQSETSVDFNFSF